MVFQGLNQFLMRHLAHTPDCSLPDSNNDFRVGCVGRLCCLPPFCFTASLPFLRSICQH